MSEQTWMDPRSQRAEWGSGAWDNEPDKVQWTDAATGLVCLAKRHPALGHWCGYVGVPETHPWHGHGYDDMPGYAQYCGPEVHGGLTYAAGCSNGPPEIAICHVPEPGQPDHLWWFGFDCGHAGDYSPFMAKRSWGAHFADDVYRDLDYVKAQCATLAMQASVVVNGRTT